MKVFTIIKKAIYKKLWLWFAVLIITFSIGLVGAGNCVVNSCSLKERSFLPPSAKPMLKAECAANQDFPGLSIKLDSIDRRKDYFPKLTFLSNEEADKYLGMLYSKRLLALKEFSLIANQNNQKEIYRVLWARSFHPFVSIRLEREADKITLFAKKLESVGGYKPYNLSANVNRQINEGEWCEFISLLDKADFWKLGKDDDFGGNDGARWALEAVKEERYHLVNRWNPNSGKYREACLYLLKLSQLKIEKSELY